MRPDSVAPAAACSLGRELQADLTKGAVMVQPACGYRGDPVCEPPDCSGACPIGKPDLRPPRPTRRSRVIRVDPEVYREIQRRAKPFETVNTAVRRILGMEP